MFLKNKRYKPGNIVPVTEEHLPEVTSKQQLSETLKRIYKDGLPGFVIRSSGLVDVEDKSHAGITQAVMDVLPDAGQATAYTLHKDGKTIPIHRSKGLSDLHHDMVTMNDTSRVRVHRTQHGSGKVTLANSGPAYADNTLQDNPRKLHLDRINHVDYDLNNGNVDPGIIDPTIYTADVSEGDTVVFPVGLPRSQGHDKAGAVWHRFDTSTQSRNAEVAIVEPVK